MVKIDASIVMKDDLQNNQYKRIGNGAKNDLNMDISTYGFAHVISAIRRVNAELQIPFLQVLSENSSFS
jgi:hypothetical protein